MAQGAVEHTVSFYKILGVTRVADERDLREAYKTEVIKAHPDKGGTPQKFALLQKAYETLRDVDKRRVYDKELQQRRAAKYYRRPPPLGNVKNPTTFALPDGEPYVFETAPDRLRCKFRHGDIVSCAGECGCFLGLGAYETLYWVKQGQSHAAALFSLGMGDDRSVHIVMRAAANVSTPMRKASSFTSSGSFSGASSFTPRRNSSANEERAHKLKEEIMRDERMRMADQRIVRLQTDERERRFTLEGIARDAWSDVKGLFARGIARLQPAATPTSHRVLSKSPVRDYIRGSSQLRSAKAQPKPNDVPRQGSIRSDVPRASSSSRASLPVPGGHTAARTTTRARTPMHSAARSTSTAGQNVKSSDATVKHVPSAFSVRGAVSPDVRLAHSASPMVKRVSTPSAGRPTTAMPPPTARCTLGRQSSPSPAAAAAATPPPSIVRRPSTTAPKSAVQGTVIHRTMEPMPSRRLSSTSPVRGPAKATTAWSPPLSQPVPIIRFRKREEGTTIAAESQTRDSGTRQPL